MKSPSLSDQIRLDAFCRDLALALRRITGKVADIEPSQLPKADLPNSRDSRLEKGDSNDPR